MSAIACSWCSVRSNGRLSRLAQRGSDLTFPFAGSAREAELEQEQLVEGEPAPPLLRLLECSGPMDGVEGIGPAGQAFPHFQRRRERIRLVRDELQGAIGKRAHSRRRDLLARGIDRREIGGGSRTVQIVRTNVERIAAELASEAHTRPGLKLVLQPILVEPHGRDRTALVGDGRRQDRQAPPRPAQRDAPDLADDHRLLLAEQVDDSALADRALVVTRAVLEPR